MCLEGFLQTQGSGGIPAFLQACGVFHAWIVLEFERSSFWELKYPGGAGTGAHLGAVAVFPVSGSLLLVYCLKLGRGAAVGLSSLGKNQ